MQAPLAKLIDAARVGCPTPRPALAVLADALSEAGDPLGRALTLALADPELTPQGVERLVGPGGIARDAVLFRFEPFARHLELSPDEHEHAAEFVLLPPLGEGSDLAPFVIARCSVYPYDPFVADPLPLEAPADPEAGEGGGEGAPQRRRLLREDDDVFETNNGLTEWILDRGLGLPTLEELSGAGDWGALAEHEPIASHEAGHVDDDGWSDGLGEPSPWLIPVRGLPPAAPWVRALLRATTRPRPRLTTWSFLQWHDDMRGGNGLVTPILRELARVPDRPRWNRWARDRLAARGATADAPPDPMTTARYAPAGLARDLPPPAQRRLDELGTLVVDMLQPMGYVVGFLLPLWLIPALGVEVGLPLAVVLGAFLLVLNSRYHPA